MKEEVKRAVRRHERDRVRRGRSRYWLAFGRVLDEKATGILARTAKPCSCLICCNVRRRPDCEKGRLTRQELIQTARHREQLREFTP